MARKQDARTYSSQLVEATVSLNPRGRSVVHGTLLVGGEMRTFKHELDYEEKSKVTEFILSALAPPASSLGGSEGS